MLSRPERSIAISTNRLPGSPARHPESGRKYDRAELEELAAEGDPWAHSKLDDWDLYDATDYVGSFRDRCPDPACELYGERVTLCYADDGTLLEVDHGGWSHYVQQEEAKAS
ncbi:hypothetical protein [Arthrobacter sp. 7Tela_A1]|uniref:hypothetical protein n=1 Tax=Arthrobacter sp. 7Tela_A1 TaxID=3093745 RepID=UPI003BB6A150